MERGKEIRLSNVSSLTVFGYITAVTLANLLTDKAPKHAYYIFPPVVGRNAECD
jgi:hypothetical protein